MRISCKGGQGPRSGSTGSPASAAKIRPDGSERSGISLVQSASTMLPVRSGIAPVRDGADDHRAGLGTPFVLHHGMRDRLAAGPGVGALTGRVRGGAWVEALATLADRPSVVGAGRDPVDRLEQGLPGIRRIQIAGNRVEGERVGVAKAVGVDLVHHLVDR